MKNGPNPLSASACAINVFEAVGYDFVLVSMNDTCHLSRFKNDPQGLPKP